jgi:hypothetical protein
MYLLPLLQRRNDRRVSRRSGRWSNKGCSVGEILGQSELELTTTPGLGVFLPFVVTFRPPAKINDAFPHREVQMHEVVSISVGTIGSRPPIIARPCRDDHAVSTRAPDQIDLGQVDMPPQDEMTLTSETLFGSMLLKLR